MEQLPYKREAFYRRERKSIPAAREFTAWALKDWHAIERLDDVLLCVSEVTTNALLHGVPPGRGFLLHIELCADRTVRVEVHDSGAGDVRLPEPEADAECGRGLLLVAALADKWGVGERDPGKTVWCEFGPPSTTGPNPGLTGGYPPRLSPPRRDKSDSARK
ncbi:ATP-binding protein [Streptomyces sp. NPDC052225]|uniref:ATP-binding protein n=1 Tax=Streptomyces sp. NPDC052225 TaxID=3154949 RepID=UPI00343F2FF2